MHVFSLILHTCSLSPSNQAFYPLCSSLSAEIYQSNQKRFIPSRVFLNITLNWKEKIQMAHPFFVLHSNQLSRRISIQFQSSLLIKCAKLNQSDLRLSHRVLLSDIEKTIGRHRYCSSSLYISLSPCPPNDRCTYVFFFYWYDYDL